MSCCQVSLESDDDMLQNAQNCNIILLIIDSPGGYTASWLTFLESSRQAIVKLVILDMTLSEPQCSCVVVTFRGINSKDEQGNDNIIACDSNGSSTATENYSTMSVTIYVATQQQSPQQQFSENIGW